MYKELIKDSEEFARRVRLDVARINNRTNDSHIGGGYSSVDILSVLYTKVLNINKENLEDPNRDIFLLSKGHIATTMYTVLAHAGIIPYEDLEKHLVCGEKYAGHTRKFFVPGIEMSAGSLGHGSCVGCGMAYAKKIKHLDGRVFVLMGDGECNEGSVWESVMFAAKFKLSNLVFIVDRNKLQAYGFDKDVLDMGSLRDKFCAFGCNAVDLDGHNHAALYNIFSNKSMEWKDKPLVVIADTIKGKGVSFMENKLEWHFKSPNDEEWKIIQEELRG